jgi:hypothetical protein
MVTNWDQYSNPLISAHCNDVKDYVWWDGGKSGTNYRYTTVSLSYSC